MLCGTPKTRCFSAFLSHFSKIIFEKGLFRQFQRFASAERGAGAGVDGAKAPQEKLEASVLTLPTIVDNQKMLAVGAAHRTREQSAGTTPVPAAKRMGLPSPL